MSEPNQWDSKRTVSGRALEAMKYGVDLPPEPTGAQGEPWVSDNGRQAHEVGLDLAALDDPTGVIGDAIDLLATWQPKAQGESK